MFRLCRHPAKIAAIDAARLGTQRKAVAMFPAYSRPILPEGFSFEVSELIMLRNWSEDNGLSMVIELDHIDGPREYEEFIRLVPHRGHHGLASLWRAHQTVIITPFGGAARRFVSMAHALSALQMHNGTINMRQDRIGGR